MHGCVRALQGAYDHIGVIDCNRGQPFRGHAAGSAVQASRRWARWSHRLRAGAPYRSGRWREYVQPRSDLRRWGCRSIRYGSRSVAVRGCHRRDRGNDETELLAISRRRLAARGQAGCRRSSCRRDRRARSRVRGKCPVQSGRVFRLGRPFESGSGAGPSRSGRSSGEHRGGGSGLPLSAHPGWALEGDPAQGASRPNIGSTGIPGIKPMKPMMAAVSVIALSTQRLIDEHIAGELARGASGDDNTGCG